MKKIRSSGFVALMSAIVISVVLLIIAVTGSFTGFFGRADVLDAESKTRSIALADACVDSLMLNLSYDATYGGGDTVTLGSDTCEIKDSPTPYDPIRTFPIQAVFNNAYTNYQITVDTDAMEVTQWAEVDTVN
jgi:hypothetical protein